MVIEAHGPGAGRIVRPGPAMPDVVLIPPGSEVPLPAGRCDVEGLACFKVHPRGEDVDVDRAVGLIVADGAPGSAVRLKTGPGQALEAVQDIIDIRPAGIILRRPGNHCGRGAVLELKGVGDPPDQHRVPAQHVNAGAWPALMVGGFLQVCRRCSPGCITGIELNHHDAARGSLMPGECR